MLCHVWHIWAELIRQQNWNTWTHEQFPRSMGVHVLPSSPWPMVNFHISKMGPYICQDKSGFLIILGDWHCVFSTLAHIDNRKCMWFGSYQPKNPKKHPPTHTHSHIVEKCLSFGHWRTETDHQSTKQLHGLCYTQTNGRTPTEWCGAFGDTEPGPAGPSFGSGHYSKWSSKNLLNSEGETNYHGQLFLVVALCFEDYKCRL